MPASTACTAVVEQYGLELDYEHLQSCNECGESLDSEYVLEYDQSLCRICQHVRDYDQAYERDTDTDAVAPRTEVV